MQEDHFFIVLASDDTRFVRHSDGDTATNEAKRLASMNASKKFFILRAESVAKVAPQPVVVEKTNDDPIPF